MKEILQKYLSELRKDRRRGKKLAGILCVLSVVIVLAVAWQLRFVGIAQTDKPACGLEEHEHTKACMERRLICGLKEGDPEPDTTEEIPVHHHDDSCYEEIKTLHCKEKEHVHTDKCYEIHKVMDCKKEEHIHTQNCYEIQDVLVCDKDHEHNKNCYEQQKVLVCGKEEHTHNDDCYKIERTLICDQKEHSHSDDCYTVERKLICGMEEGQVLETSPSDPTDETRKHKGHVHTDECYDIVYVCGKKEHKHNLNCYSDPDADVETYIDWEKTLPDEMGHTWGENVLKVAQAQMGYKESAKNFQASKDGQEKLGYSRYGEWFGSDFRYAEWNTIFTSFCLYYAGVPEQAVPRHSGAFAMSVKLEEIGLLEDASYKPKPGDVVFMQDLDQKNINRTAIVASLGNMMVDDEKVPCITIIEGDRDNAVSPYKYPVDDDVIQGYLSMEHAYQRALEEGIPMEDIPEKETTAPTDATGATTPEETTAPTEVLSDEELDGELQKLLDAFNAYTIVYREAEAASNEDGMKTAKAEMDQIFAQLQNIHGRRYPEGGEADFVSYLNTEAQEDYKIYTAACEKAAEDAKKPAKKDAPLNTETEKLLKALAEKAAEYEKTVGTQKNKQARKLAEEMNLLYAQARVLYLNQFSEKDAAAFEAYVKENYTNASDMLKHAEDTYGTNALDAMLRSKLAKFSEKAKQCSKAMNVGKNKTAVELKLDLDQLYLEMKELHGKRYPDAEEGSFDIFLNNNHSKAVKRYLSAVRAFPEAKLDNYITYTDFVSGEVRRIFNLEDGMEVDVSLTGSICFPVAQKAEEPIDAKATTANLETVANDGAADRGTQAAAEGKPATLASSRDPENSDEKNHTYGRNAGNDSTRWENIEVNLLPVSDEVQAAFAQYVMANYPETKGMTMLNIEYQYNGLELDVGKAEALMTLIPGEKTINPQPAISTMMMEDEGHTPVVQNGPAVRSVSPAMESVENRKTRAGKGASADEPVQLTLLEYKPDGEIRPVATAAAVRNAEESPKLQVPATPESSYAMVATPFTVTNVKPIDPNKSYNGRTYPYAKAYPPKWGDHVKNIWGNDVTKDTNGKEKFVENETLILRNDPYFQEGVKRWPASGGVYGYETPSATLGYVMRNYNVFAFGDAIVSHVVGSAAIQGTAWYETWQGGTGGGGAAYVPIPNFSPTYLKGRVRRMNASYDNPLSDTPAAAGSSEKIEIMVNAGVKTSNPDMGFPTYFGTDNIGHVSKCNIFQQNNPGEELPWYFTDQYMQFEDFRNHVHTKLDNNAIQGIKVMGDNLDARLETDHFQWEQKSNEKFRRLYLRMGHVYNIGSEDMDLAGIETNPKSLVDNSIKDLQNVQIILVPPDGYKFNDPPTATADRAAQLALDKINTVITCNAGTVTLPGIDHGKDIPSIKYYVDDIGSSNGFHTDAYVNDVMLAGHMEEDSTNSVVLSFPYAKHVELGKRAAHILVPRGTLYIPNTGDNYGCNLVQDLKCAGDLHMLPYAGKTDGIEEPHPIEIPPISKYVKVNDVIKPAVSSQKFNFILRAVEKIETQPDPAQNGVLPSDLPHIKFNAQWTGSNEWDSVNAQSPIRIDVLEKIRKKPDDFLNIFKNLIVYGKDNASGYHQRDEGIYIFELYEDDVPSGYKKDPTKYEVRFEVLTRWDGVADKLWVKSTTFKNLTTGEIVDKIQFINEKMGGPELPHTGGVGTAVFYLTGTALAASAMFVLTSKKKRIQ